MSLSEVKDRRKFRAGISCAGDYSVKSVFILDFSQLLNVVAL